VNLNDDLWLIHAFIIRFSRLITQFETRLSDSGKIPLPAKMYTKPVDVNIPHHFAPPKKIGGDCGGVVYDPLPWNDFFDRKETLDGKIPVYIAGTSGHVFLCLHGAGHSALSFAALAKNLK
jgi:hypothetical protein